ncbi:uncharacterized protein O3C94_010649 [Discoglossus pictus]
MERSLAFADVALSSAFIIFPKTILELQGAEPIIDGVHCHMTRSLGCVWLAGSLKLLLFTRTKDAVSLAAQGAARCIAFLTVLLNTLHGVLVTPSVFNAQLPWFDLLVCSLFIISSCLMIHYNRWEGPLSLGHRDPHSPFLRVDFLATFVFGLLWLAYPHWLLGFQVSSPLDALHLHITRSFGAMMVGDSLVTLAAQWFTSSQDKTSVFTGRVTATSILLLSMLWTHNTTMAWTGAHVWFGMVGSVLWIGNSILGYLKTSHAKNF